MAMLTMDAQDIPNPTFEEWESVGGWFYNPTGWQTMNNQVLLSTEQDSASCEGNLSMRVKPLSGFETVMGAASVEFYTSFIPASLTFCVKTNVIQDEFFTDTCRVMISFYNGDINFYSEEWVNTESITNWQEVTIPLSQIEPVMDGCKIEVQASYPGSGLGSGSADTWISLDNFRFDGVSSIENTKTQSFKVAPNPSANGKVNLLASGALGEVKIYDVLGHEVYSSKTLHNKLDLELNLKNGLYFIKTKYGTHRLIIQ